MNKLHSYFFWIALSTFLIFPAISSADPVVYVGSNNVVGFDGIERNISVTMTFEDIFNKNGGTPPPGFHYHDSFGHFGIYTYLVEVEGIGIFAGSNGRLNIWLDQTPTEQNFYTEELEVLEMHSLMLFFDGSGNPYDWSAWMGVGPDYELPEVLVITRLNISPEYAFDLGNEIHLKPLRCKRSCKRDCKHNHERDDKDKDEDEENRGEKPGLKQ
ncbi:MAG: hypothetical protein ABW170_24455 [Candidatus Thiodiazotropha sp. L084R]